MRKVLLLGAFCMGLIAAAQAQQIPQFSQYMFNYFPHNPAFAGKGECIDVRAGWREQWVGLEGAPSTGFINFHGPIKNAHGFQKNKHGLGGGFFQDKAGAFQRIDFFASYAYHMKIKRGYMFSSGISVGMINETIDQGLLGNVFDPVVGANSGMTVPNIAIGGYLYTEDKFFGLSMSQIVGQRMKSIGLDTRYKRHLNFAAGVRIDQKDSDVDFIPSTMVRFVGGAAPSIDLNLQAEFQKKLALGIGFRNDDALIFSFKARFLRKFSIGYSYDLTISKLAPVSSNTHEIILGITSCPGNPFLGDHTVCPTI